MIKQILPLLMLVGLASGQCDEGYTEYDGECYYDNDLSFLTLIIYLNDIEFELFYDIGLTIWQNGHINTLLLEGLAIHEVPTNIQNLDSVITLSFSDNELEYLPATIGNLPSLNTLILSNNLLIEIPEETGNLSNLEFLHLPGNQLVSLPSTISNLSSLISLNIDNNLVTTFPSGIMELNTLRYFYMANNTMQELPSDIGTLSALQILSAYSNTIAQIPSSIGELSNLYHLDFMNNELTDIPETICNIYDNLTVFSIGLNYICPPYPDCVEDNMGEQDTTNCNQISIMDETFPFTYKLHSAYPNPFNPVTTLRYDLPEDALVNITIYDMMGRVVKTLINDQQTAGYRSIQWNATNDAGQPVSAGLYLYTIQAGEFRQTKKMVLLK
ncbi:MAG: T9SS type A sorting domain-containing protein [Candidatus Neomarinimicrobiota bacterium]|nr:T9SS type A sorting domain-containing protein [Candidatus Neomarinimicrobiota bacterium]